MVAKQPQDNRHAIPSVLLLAHVHISDNTHARLVSGIPCMGQGGLYMAANESSI